MPDNPGAWLMATAKHKGVDLIRRERTLDEKYGRIAAASGEGTVPRGPDDHVPQLGDVEGQQVDVEVVAVDLEVHLPSDEGEPGPELAQRVDRPVHECLLEVPLADAPVQTEEVEDLGVLGQLLRQLGVPRHQVPLEVGRSSADALVRTGPPRRRRTQGGSALTASLLTQLRWGEGPALRHRYRPALGNPSDK